MKKVILLLIVVVILIVTLLVIRRRRKDHRNFAGTTLPQESKEVEGEKVHGSQVDLILSKDETLLSYSILVKNIEKPVENAYFTVGGERIKQISGPRSYQRGASDMILHGLWRETDARPFTAERVEQLKNGQLKVSIELKDGGFLEVPINGNQ